MEDTRRGFIQKLSATLFGSEMSGAVSELSNIDPNSERFEHVLVPAAEEVSVATKVVSRSEDEVEENFPVGKQEKKVPLETESERVINFIPIRYDSEKDNYQYWAHNEWKIIDNVEETDSLGWFNYSVRTSDIENGDRIWKASRHAELEEYSLGELLTGQSSELDRLNSLIETRLPRGTSDIDELVDSILESSVENTSDIRMQILDDNGQKRTRVVNEEGEDYEEFVGKDKIEIFYSEARDYSNVSGPEVEQFMEDWDKPHIWPKYKKSEDEKESENLWIDNGLVLDDLEADEEYSIDFTDLENNSNYADENVYHGDEIIINVGASGEEARASIRTTGERNQHSSEEINYKLNQISKGELEPTNNDEKALKRLIDERNQTRT